MTVKSDDVSYNPSLDYSSRQELVLRKRVFCKHNLVIYLRTIFLRQRCQSGRSPTGYVHFSHSGGTESVTICRPSTPVEVVCSSVGTFPKGNNNLVFYEI